MVNTNVSLGAFALDNPVIPASGTFAFGHEFADIYDINCLGSISLKGTTAQPAVRQSDAAHRGDPLRHDQFGRVCKTPASTRLFPKKSRNLPPAFTKRRSPISPAFRSKNTSSAPKSSTPATAIGHAGDQHQLPERPRRRNELRHRTRGRRGRSARAVKARTQKARVHQTYAERDGHHEDRPRL